MLKPIYRADHVGSLLRSEIVQKARKEYFTNKSIGIEELTNIEDNAIHELIKMQEETGLMVVTDGEQRRSFFGITILWDNYRVLKWKKGIPTKAFNLQV